MSGTSRHYILFHDGGNTIDQAIIPVLHDLVARCFQMALSRDTRVEGQRVLAEIAALPSWRKRLLQYWDVSKRFGYNNSARLHEFVVKPRRAVSKCTWRGYASTYRFFEPKQRLRRVRKPKLLVVPRNVPLDTVTEAAPRTPLQLTNAGRGTRPVQHAPMPAADGVTPIRFELPNWTVQAQNTQF